MKDELIKYVMEKANLCYSDDFPDIPDKEG